MWSPEDRCRAPISDFPPPWASAWGDDPYGLWADLTVNDVTQRMRWIEPSLPEGFLMGDKQTGLHREFVRAGFWLADTPCTQAFWQAVTGKNPSYFKQGADAPDRPVENVNWDTVMEQFVARFAQRPDWGTEGRLCLPTEVEWEYAARAGMRTEYWWGDAWDATCGNVDVTGKRGLNDKEGTTPVHRYQPNPWGLLDVHGNVWEWCSDVWHPRRDAPEARPDENVRVVRGGSWISHPGIAHVAYRLGRPRRNAILDRGFRFALRSPVGAGR